MKARFWRLLAAIGLVSAAAVAAGPWLEVTYLFDQQPTKLMLTGFDSQPVLGALLAVGVLLLVLGLWLRGKWRYLVAFLTLALTSLAITSSLDPALPSVVRVMIEKSSGLSGTDAVQALSQLNRMEFIGAMALFAIALTISSLSTAKASARSKARSRFDRDRKASPSSAASAKDEALDLWDDQRS